MTIKPQLADYFEQHAAELGEQFATALRDMKNSPYRNLDLDMMKQMASAPFVAIAKALRGDLAAMTTYARETIRRRKGDPSMTSEMIGDLGETMHKATQPAIAKLFDEELPQAQARTAVAELIMHFNKVAFIEFLNIRQEELQAREQEIAEIQESYEQVSAAVRELSAPIAPIHDNVLVLPLVGTIDTNRAQTITEDLLEEIVSRQSDIVIMDITGVPVVDTNIANYLLQTTRAVNLLGAQVILVGISAEVAQTIVGLELDLRQLTVRANLQDGIEYALEQLGLGIRPIDHEQPAL